MVMYVCRSGQEYGVMPVRVMPIRAMSVRVLPIRVMPVRLEALSNSFAATRACVLRLGLGLESGVGLGSHEPRHPPLPSQ